MKKFLLLLLACSTIKASSPTFDNVTVSGTLKVSGTKNGTAFYADTGTASNQVPTNGNLTGLYISATNGVGSKTLISSGTFASPTISGDLSNTSNSSVLNFEDGILGDPNDPGTRVNFGNGTLISGGIGGITVDWINRKLTGGNWDLDSNKITGLADPENDNDAVNKIYVDNGFVPTSRLAGSGTLTVNTSGAIAPISFLTGTSAMVMFNSSGTAVATTGTSQFLIYTGSSTVSKRTYPTSVTVGSIPVFSTTIGDLDKSVGITFSGSGASSTLAVTGVIQSGQIIATSGGSSTFPPLRIMGSGTNGFWEISGTEIGFGTVVSGTMVQKAGWDTTGFYFGTTLAKSRPAAAIIKVSGTLVGGTATFSNASITSSPLNVWVQDNASSLTNVGSLVVTVSGTTATVTSTNVLDVSPFTGFISP